MTGIHGYDDYNSPEIYQLAPFVAGAAVVLWAGLTLVGYKTMRHAHEYTNHVWSARTKGAVATGAGMVGTVASLYLFGRSVGLV